MRAVHRIPAVLAAAAAALLTLTSCDALRGAPQPAGPPTVDTAAHWRPGVGVSLPDSLANDFIQLQPTLPGQVGLAIMPVGGGRVTVFGDWSSGIAWSTIKVPLAMAALRHDSGERVRELALAAITVSDNDAAQALWESLGDGLQAGAAVQQVLDEAGDGMAAVAGPRTRLDYTAFGQTEWTLTNQVRFASRLPCLAQSDQVTDLMAHIAQDQSWGLGVIDGTEFKGGWGPDDDTGIYTVRQFGLVPTPTGRIAVALAAQADSGDFTDAADILSKLGELVGRHIAELQGGGCDH
ncbi:hypothetical protein [Nocardia panacis]|uniref:hypothetical protein n=1 Tax=Nocardia panacis TaxID=2340916 RepID=UPI001EF12513|nr:hypothetical protein [Nocardia panacis]